MVGGVIKSIRLLEMMSSIILAHRCQHCGGFLHKPDWDRDIICCVCSRPHNENGELLIPEVRYYANLSDRTPQQGIDNRD